MSIVIAGAIVINEALHQDSWWYGSGLAMGWGATTAPHASCPSTMIKGVLRTCTAYSRLAIISSLAKLPAMRQTNKSPRAVSKQFRSNPGIGTTQHCSEWILACTQRLAFMHEIVAKAHACDVAAIAFHQAIEGCGGGDDILRFRWGLVIRGHRPWDNQARR